MTPLEVDALVDNDQVFISWDTAYLVGHSIYLVGYQVSRGTQLTKYLAHVLTNQLSQFSVSDFIVCKTNIYRIRL